MAAAAVTYELRSRRFVQAERLFEELKRFAAIEAVGHWRVSSRVSHTLPAAQRRLTVATDTDNDLATSSMDNPPNTRNPTISAAIASYCSSSVNSSSTSRAS